MGNSLGCIQVEQSTIAIKEQFEEILPPGCHWCMPWCLGIQLAGYRSLRVQKLDVRCQTKTKDNFFVTFVASVHYRALADKATGGAYYELSNTREHIQNCVFDVIRASVPMINLDSVFEKKKDIAKSVEAEVGKAMSMYGYEIVQTLIVDIELEECVKKSMKEFNEASKPYEAIQETYLRHYYGKGIACACETIAKGLEECGFSSNDPGTSTKDVLDMILVTKYIRTMEKIAASPNSTCVFVPYGPGAIKDVANQIRRDAPSI